MQIRELQQQVVQKLQMFPMPQLEAKELVACGLGIAPKQLLVMAMQEINCDQQANVWALVNRRLAQEPLAYILQEWDFYGITIEVTPDVLIPRSDTEALCELAIQAAQTVSQPKILDLCSGSGCIALAMLTQLKQATALAIDLSPKAVALAQRNARRLNLEERYQCMQGDALVFPPTQLCNMFDIMVCNPPYITHSEMQALEESVSKYEPHLALYGGVDGLDFYRTIMRTWANCLKPNGILFFECGFAQGSQVVQILTQNHWKQIENLTDYAGVPRIVRAIRPE